MKKKKWLIMLAAIIVLAAVWMSAAHRWTGVYTLVRHGVWTVYSTKDADGDLVDDYTDIVRTARAYVETKPEYVPDYVDGGYPPEGQGVCTDVLWRALKGAGYDLKAMVDADILAAQSAYPLPDGALDPNIDFRRVVNLMVFFERHCTALTCDPADKAAWQPGDIVFYQNHVAVVSDKRNDQGQCYIIHHAGYGAFEEDALTARPILAHYRWKLKDL